MALLKRTLALVVLLAASGTARAEVASEYDVKAAFLYNFTKFVEWPASAFEDERSNFRICVYGEDPFGKSLWVVSDEPVAGRKVTLLGMANLKPESCHILFISRSERSRISQILEELRDTPVLTVADTDGFLDRGGIINFVLEGSKVRFEISQQAAERAGIKISSKLLRLAVGPKGSPGP